MHHATPHGPLWQAGHRGHGRGEHPARTCETGYEEATELAEREEGTCEAVVVHGTKLAALQPLLVDEGRAQAEAERFRALGDPSRLRILCALSLAELCVCDLSGLLGVTQTATSQHLKILRTLGMVRYRRQGRMAFYRLADPSLAGLLARMRATPGEGDVVRERRSI